MNKWQTNPHKNVHLLQMDASDSSSELLTSLLEMTVEASRQLNFNGNRKLGLFDEEKASEQVSTPSLIDIKPASFDDMPDELHRIILNNLMQNEKLMYGLIGRRYNKLTVESLFKHIGVDSENHDTMPCNLRYGMTVVGQKTFDKLIFSDTWKRNRHLVKTLTAQRKLLPWRTFTRDDTFSLASRTNYKETRYRFKLHFTSFKRVLSPVELDVRVSDMNERIIPAGIRRLSINFEGTTTVENQINQLKFWGQSFSQLKGLRLWNVRHFQEVITQDTLELKDSQLLEIEDLDIRCNQNSMVELTKLFNPKKVKRLFLQNAYNQEFIFQCKDLRTMGLFFRFSESGCLRRDLQPSGKSFPKDLSDINMSNTLVEFRTNLLSLVEDKKYLRECSKLQTICVVPTLFDSTEPIMEYCEYTIQMLQKYNKSQNHPQLEYFQYGVEFNLVRVDGKYVESVIRGPKAATQYSVVYGSDFNSSKVLKRRIVNGLQKKFYEYYIV